jgi:hypothetical protein
MPSSGNGQAGKNENADFIVVASPWQRHLAA